MFAFDLFIKEIYIYSTLYTLHLVILLKFLKFYSSFNCLKIKEEKFLIDLKNFAYKRKGLRY